MFGKLKDFKLQAPYRKAIVKFLLVLRCFQRDGQPRRGDMFIARNVRGIFLKPQRGGMVWRSADQETCRPDGAGAHSRGFRGYKHVVPNGTIGLAALGVSTSAAKNMALLLWRFLNVPFH